MEHGNLTLTLCGLARMFRLAAFTSEIYHAHLNDMLLEQTP
jgi:hypothetical protein